MITCVTLLFPPEALEPSLDGTRILGLQWVATMARGTKKIEDHYFRQMVVAMFEK